VEPFSVSVPDAELDDLRERLRRTRWPDQVTGAGWDYGIPLDYVQDVCRYWAEQYDWRAREARLNGFEQFRTTIDGLGVHLIHARSPEPDAFPVVITHGWPGSVIEFLKVIGPLTDPVAHGGDAGDAFHVVCPSLPGYGYSDRPAEPGWNADRTAKAWQVLMDQLGYARYGAQGGDWGSFVSTLLAVHDPDHCAALHLNMPIAPPDPATMEDLTDAEKRSLEDAAEYDKHDSGYMKQQSTRPQTLAYGLVDSPVAQAAWIIEKFWAWTDCDGHPENVLTRDELLDNVMLYWLTATGGSSARMYYETIGAGGPDLSAGVKVPTGCSIFPREIFRPSRRWAEKRFNVVYWSEPPKGGHFAAFEQPDLFVEELRSFFRPFR
jgi:pimeloyl-ACP methyl ester carboxylesterase